MANAKEGSMKIDCTHDELVEPHKLVPHPKNPNTHSEDQIERLSKIIDYQGQRSPIIVSKQSGFIIAGHGRLEAMKKLNWEKVAVNFQDFENDAQEYAHMTADNAIAEWAALDLGKINQDFLDLGPDLDIEMLGFKDFEVEPLDADLPDLGDGSDPDIQQVTFTLSNEQKDILDEAMDKAKAGLDCTDEINQNKNGNILAAMARWYCGS